MNELLPFEIEKCRDPRRFPMHLRLKLDLCGLKLGKQDWARFAPDERERLLALRCDTPAQVVLFRKNLLDLIQAYGGTVIEITPEFASGAAYRPWMDKTNIPATVRQQVDALADGAARLEQWAKLSDLQRFALIKLTEPGKLKPQLRQVLEDLSLLPLESE